MMFLVMEYLALQDGITWALQVSTHTENRCLGIKECMEICLVVVLAMKYEYLVTI
jgi:hypothetical protein